MAKLPSKRIKGVPWRRRYRAKWLARVRQWGHDDFIIRRNPQMRRRIRRLRHAPWNVNNDDDYNRIRQNLPLHGRHHSNFNAGRYRYWKQTVPSRARYIMHRRRITNQRFERNNDIAGGMLGLNRLARIPTDVMRNIASFL